MLVTLADKIKENRFKILIMCYLSFAIISNTVTTGAFEVYFGDTLVFSKIRKYRYPTTEVIFCCRSSFLGHSAFIGGVCPEA